MKNINSCSPDFGVFFPDVHAETFNVSLSSLSYSPSLLLIHELRRLGNLIILAKFHLISERMHSLQKQALIFGGRSSMTKKCHITSLVKSASTLNLCWLKSIAINVNKQVICFLVVINHVNDFGNLD